MKLNEKIYFYRKKAGLSQDALAEAVGVSRQAVSKWETGDSVPETGKLLSLASALGISVDTLLSEAEPGESRDSGVFTGEYHYDAGAEGDCPSGADWIDGLPARLQRIARRWGWLAGIYIALCGAPLVIIGALARYLSNRMVSSFNELPFGNAAFGDIFGSAIEIDGVPVQVGAAAQFNPVATVGTVMIIAGAALTAAGIALAVFLKRRSAK